jgi:acyl carrier protein
VEGRHVTTNEKIRNFVVKNFYVAGRGELRDDASLLEEGIIDSTGVLEVLTFIEQEFGIKTPDEDIVPENFDGINRITAFVESRLASVAR